MKRVSFLLIFISSLAFGGGIPVIDVAANKQIQTQNIKQIEEWRKDAQRWIETTQHYKSQLEAYKNQLASLTNPRDVGSFLKDLEELYSTSMDIYDDAKVDIGEIEEVIKNKEKKTSKLDKDARKLVNKYLGEDYCNVNKTKDAKDLCMSRAVDEMKDIIIIQSEITKIDNTNKRLQQLSKKLQKSKDLKESADINNAIQANVALMNANKISIELLEKRRETAANIRAKQQAKIDQKNERKFLLGR